MSKVSMAKAKATKLSDTERCLNFNPGTTANVTCVHLNLGLSAANRRLYRQLRCYRGSLESSRWTTGGSGDNCVYKVYTLSTAWWVTNAIKLARKTWLAHSKDERKMIGSGKARYFDFIIADGLGDGKSADFMQFDNEDPMVATELVIDENLMDAQQFYLTRRDEAGADASGDAFATVDTIGFTCGDDSDLNVSRSYNIFTEYIKNLNIDPQSDVRVEGAYADLMESDPTTHLALQTVGDEPPWDADTLPQPWIHRGTIGFTANNTTPKLTTGLMDVPLGMILIEKVNNVGDALPFVEAEDNFCFKAKKGTYRGVDAPVY